MIRSGKENAFSCNEETTEYQKENWVLKNLIKLRHINTGICCRWKSEKIFGKLEKQMIT